MEANKRQYHYNNSRTGNTSGTGYSGRGYNTGTSYIEGSTVRKLEAVPDIRRKEQPYVTPSHRRKTHRQPKSLSGINLASLMVLTAAIIATLYICVDYLKLQNEVNRLDKDIIILEDELTVLTKENDAAYNLVNETYDLDYVYQVAVEELGMVYPNNNTVITYESNESGFVRQYEDIPQ